MKIIDAHLHLFPEDEPQFEEMAQSVGHHNSTAHLRQAYRDRGLSMAWSWATAACGLRTTIILPISFTTV